jgi:hypothetical protein
VQFWLKELRTPELLLECAHAHRDQATFAAADRPAVAAALSGESVQVAAALDAEQARERELDRAYWAPLRTELEQLRRSAGSA